MKNLILRGIEPLLYQRLKRESGKAGMSLNKFIIFSLAKVFGTRPADQKHHDLDSLFGRWTKEDVRSFQKSTKGFETTDPELWKTK